MDHTTFDALMLRVARQTTRRAALATLLGGAILLHEPAASDATKEAKRRKDRRRKRGRRKKTNFPGQLKPISLRIDNTAGTNTVTVEARSTQPLSPKCCVFQNRVSIPPGETRPFDLPYIVGKAWIADEYWFEFENRPLLRPEVSIAVDGRPQESVTCCQPFDGITWLQGRPVSEGASFNIMVNGHDFRVTRNRDTNYKVFTVTLPPTL